MARRKVIFSPNSYYHIYNRGAHRIDIFRSDADYVFLLKKLKELTARYNISVVAYCLMSNHYHLLLRQNGEFEISSLMQALFNSYSKAFNIKYRHSGTLFEGPYRATAVDSGPYLLHLCRYIHRNPLEASMVVKPEQWHYSNYPEFIGLRGGTLVDSEFVQVNFGTPEAYRAFVMEYVPPEKIQKELRPYFLG
jgi:REP element-mobilizing transposase RayT